MSTILVVDDERDQQEAGLRAVKAAGHAGAKTEDLHHALLYLEQYNEAENVTGNDPSMVPDRSRDRIDWDGVITDVHYRGDFSEEGHCYPKGGPYPPYGIALATLCYRLGIPVVICTDVHHHSSLWIRRFARQLGIPVVDDKKTTPDAWGRAVQLLEKKIAEKSVTA